MVKEFKCRLCVYRGIVDTAFNVCYQNNAGPERVKENLVFVYSGPEYRSAASTPNISGDLNV